MAPAMAAFAAYADDLSAAGVLITTEVLDTVASTTTVTARNGAPEIQDGPVRRHQGETRRHLRHRRAGPRRGARTGRSATPRTAGVRSRSARWHGHTPPTAGGTTPDADRRGWPDDWPWSPASPMAGCWRCSPRPGATSPPAEDALADALERALTRWPTDGVPANPEAWLLTVARNRLRDTVEVARAPDQRPARRNWTRRQRVEFDDTTASDASRPQARADAGVRAPGHRGNRPHAVDVAGGARRRCGGHRGGVRRGTGGHGAAPGARQEAHPRCGHTLRRTRTRTSSPSGCLRCWKRCTAPTRSTGNWRRRCADRIAVGRGAAPGAAARRAAAGRARGIGAGGADVPVGGPAGPPEPTTGRFVPLDEQDAARWDRVLIDRAEGLLIRAHGHRSSRPVPVRGGHPVRRTASRQRERALGRRHAADAANTCIAALMRVCAVLGGRGGPGRARRRDRRTRRGPAALDALAPRSSASSRAGGAGPSARVAGPRQAAADCYRRAIALTTAPALAEHLSRRLREAGG